jgi:hypothetical protein
MKLKNSIYNLLRGQAVKFVLRKIGVAITGPWGWVISYIVVPLLDKIAKPLYDFCVRKGKVVVTRLKVKKKVRKLKESRDEDEFNSAADDI